MGLRCSAPSLPSSPLFPRSVEDDDAINSLHPGIRIRARFIGVDESLTLKNPHQTRSFVHHSGNDYERCVAAAAAAAVVGFVVVIVLDVGFAEKEEEEEEGRRRRRSFLLCSAQRFLLLAVGRDRVWFFL